MPGGHGIGDLGAEAQRFAGFLGDAGQRIWQVLPLGPTGFGDSPYQCFSAFAGNPLLVSLDTLVEQGWLDAACLNGVKFLEGRASFEAAQAFKLPLLKRAADNFAARAGAEARQRFAEFCARESTWLDDFALFMAAKRLYDGAPWWGSGMRHWGGGQAGGAQETRGERAGGAQRGEVRPVGVQRAVGPRCAAALPAAGHRTDRRPADFMPACRQRRRVWCQPQLWRLREDGRPAQVSGVPPDYFSQTGQLWGNPTYNWEAMAEDGFAWWVARFSLHFQAGGTPFGWIISGAFRPIGKCPATRRRRLRGAGGTVRGAALFEAVEGATGAAGDCGREPGRDYAPRWSSCAKRFGYPGMAVLQFAFGTDAQAVSFRPHNYRRELVAYSGTHDNDTTMGWWYAGAGAGSYAERGGDRG